MVTFRMSFVGFFAENRTSCHIQYGPSQNPRSTQSKKGTWQAGRSPQEVDVGSSTLGPEYPDVPSYVRRKGSLLTNQFKPYDPCMAYLPT